MATYNVKEPIDITRQEANDSDLTFVVPNALNIVNADCTLKVYTDLRNPIISKTMTATTQIIYFAFTDTEMTNKKGRYQWQLNVTIGANVYTIGKGPFNIV